MAASFYIKQDDTLPVIERQLISGAGTPLDLTGATIEMRMKMESGAVAVNYGACSIVGDATNGTVQYAWTATDTATAGRALAEFRVTYPGGGIETPPNDGQIEIQITPKL